MALFARDLGMDARQWILCLRVVELLCLLPVVEIRVAALAIRSKLTFVRVGMAGRAILRKS